MGRPGAVTAIAALAVTVLSAVACGNDGGNVGRDDGGSGAGRAGVSSVTMTRTGGIAGVHQARTVRAAGAPPAGLTTQERDRLLRLAGGQDFRDLDRSYVPAGFCCDQFHYQITVRYEDGALKRTATADGADAPRVLETVVGLMAKARPG